MFRRESFKDLAVVAILIVGALWMLVVLMLISANWSSA
jgi:hypothetical protein